MLKKFQVPTPVDRYSHVNTYVGNTNRASAVLNRKRRNAGNSVLMGLREKRVRIPPGD